jgi:hypothetical protein
MTQVSINTVLQDTLVVLARQSTGFSSSEVSGYTAAQVRALADTLVLAGTLHRAKVSYRVVRYFSSEVQASAFVLGHLTKSAKALASASPRTKATWARDAPMNITPDTKITVAPPPPTGIFKTNTHSR